MSAAESNLWPKGEVGKSGVVNSFGQSGLSAAPIGTGIEGEAEPAIEVIGEAEAPPRGFGSRRLLTGEIPPGSRP